MKRKAQTKIEVETVIKTPLIDEHLAAEYLGLAVGTLRNWRNKGKGPRYFKLGSKIRYTVKDLEKFIEAHTVDAVG